MMTVLLTQLSHAVSCISQADWLAKQRQRRAAVVLALVDRLVQNGAAALHTYKQQNAHEDKSAHMHAHTLLLLAA